MQYAKQVICRHLLAGPFAFALAFPTRAAEMGTVAIHGSVSTTAAYSPEYNYLGDTKDSVDLNQTEITVNGTHRFENGLKVAAQLYAYDFSGYEDLTVDFANADYSFRREAGVRVGRNKLSIGFYNEVQDLDQIRIFASLPLNFYQRSSRSFGANFDGASFYGNVGVGNGSVDYQVYYGDMQPIDPDAPFMKGLGASKLDINTTYGAALAWNNIIDGLRVGVTYFKLPEIDLNSGPAISTIDYQTQVASVEYTRDRWIFAAEYKHIETDSQVQNFPLPPSHGEEDHSYVQVTYQATDTFGIGAYYAYSDYSTKGADKDTALAASYALQSWWLVKAEVHFMDGIGNLGHSGDSNPGATDETWTYFVLKTGISF